MEKKFRIYKLVRRVIPININSICRPPSKPPDKQNIIEGDISERTLPYINLIYRPPPKPTNMNIMEEER